MLTPIISGLFFSCSLLSVFQWRWTNSLSREPTWEMAKKGKKRREKSTTQDCWLRRHNMPRICLLGPSLSSVGLTLGSFTRCLQNSCWNDFFLNKPIGSARHLHHPKRLEVCVWPRWLRNSLLRRKAGPGTGGLLQIVSTSLQRSKDPGLLFIFICSCWVIKEMRYRLTTPW